MGKGKYEPTTLEIARDELFSHIRRCGVLEADDGQQREWLEETIEYLRERFPDLSASDAGELEEIGRRYCMPAIPHGEATAQDAWDRDSEDEPATSGAGEGDAGPAEEGSVPVAAETGEDSTDEVTVA